MPCIEPPRACARPRCAGRLRRLPAAALLGRLLVGIAAPASRRRRRRRRRSGRGAGRRAPSGAPRCRRRGPVRNWDRGAAAGGARGWSRPIPAAPTWARVPDLLLAIPVLEIELNGDGSVRRIEVLRQPRQAQGHDRSSPSTRCAAPRPSATCRACPSPGGSPRPSCSTTTRSFKPRTLDHERSQSRRRPMHASGDRAELGTMPACSSTCRPC